MISASAWLAAVFRQLIECVEVAQLPGLLSSEPELPGSLWLRPAGAWGWMQLFSKSRPRSGEWAAAWWCTQTESEFSIC